MSTIWKYLKRDVKTPLPSPSGSLSGVISTSRIVSANKELQKVIKESEDRTLRKRGPYEHFSAQEKAKIGKDAAEHGVAATVRRYQKLFPMRSVKESSVRTWRNKYLEELQTRNKEGREMVVKELPNKKRGRPLMLGDKLNE